MSPTRTKLSAARRYLEVFEESWHADHAAAMQCRDFEEALAEAVKVFELVDELVRLRRESVFRGLQQPEPALDEDEKAVYMQWLSLIERDTPQLEAFEKSFGAIEGAEKLRTCLARAREFLARWAPAVPSRAAGSRALEFSKDDADQFRALLDSPAGAAGRPTRPPRPLPAGDPSRLR
jgi:hypothetical protein